MAEKLVSSQTTVNYDLVYPWAGAQTFVVGADPYDVTRVQLRLANSDPQETSTTTVKIYSVDVNHKPDALLATMGSIASSALTTSFAWKTFADATCVLEAGTEYALVFEVTGDSGHSVRCAGQAAAVNYSWTKLTEPAAWTTSGCTNGFYVYGTYHNPPAKASVPDPADTATEVSTALELVMWETDGYENSVDVYFGETGSMELLESAWTEGNYYLLPALTPGAEYSWRIDTTNEAGTTEGDVWTFTVALALALTPFFPEHEATGIKIAPAGLTWECEGFDADTMAFDVYFRMFGVTEFTLVGDGLTPLTTAIDDLDYNFLYFWKVKVRLLATDEILLEGDEWNFNTEALTKYPVPRTRTVLKPGQPPGGDTMVCPTAENGVGAIRYLLAASQNTLWYEYVAGT